MQRVPGGLQRPDAFNVIIEIASGSGEVKYEVNKDTGFLTVDRFMSTAMHYPCNYGFVPETLAEDGDPVDVLLLTPGATALLPGCMVKARALGVLVMADEKGEDHKILAAPLASLCPQLTGMQQLSDVAPILLDQIVHFFAHYKDLELNKWVKVRGWENKGAADHILKTSIERYQTRPVSANELSS